MNPLLRFECVRKTYGQVTALDRVSLDVPEGGILAVLGPNGSGKSTLFGCLLGFVRPTSGQMEFCGSPVSALIRRRFGYLAERVSLYPNRSILENGVFFGSLRGSGTGEIEHQLGRVGLSDHRHRKVGTLSKGLLQRAGLAIALVGEPDLLVLDEPFNGLDPELLDNVLEILREEHARGATLLISTHNHSVVEPLASHVAVLREGALRAFGSLGDLQAGCGTALLEEIYRHALRAPLTESQPQPEPAACR